jgi:nitroreductase
MQPNDYDKLLELVQNRRSCRRFKTDSVSDDLIKKIVDAARWAPSGFNTQPWEFVVLKEDRCRGEIVNITASYWDDSVEMEKTRAEWQGRKWELKGMTNEPGDYSDAPVYIFLFGDSRFLDALPMGVQWDPHRKRLIYQSSLANAFLYMQLAASTLGLGAQWYSVVQTPKASALIKNFLGVPQEFDMYDMMALGYPARKAPKKPLRKLDEILHWEDNNQDSFKTKEEVRDFVKKTRAWVTGCHSKKAED